jgi:hypothetical protein
MATNFQSPVSFGARGTKAPCVSPLTTSETIQLKVNAFEKGEYNNIRFDDLLVDIGKL